MARVRDFQVQKCYSWERLYFRSEPIGMTMQEMKDLAKAACKFYKCKGVEVRDGRGRRGACYKPWRHTIDIPTGMRRKCVVLHEVAHAIVCHKLEKRDKIKYPSHGAVFMGVFITLIVEFYPYLFLPQVLSHARNYGLKVWIPNEPEPYVPPVYVEEEIQPSEIYALRLQEAA